VQTRLYVGNLPFSVTEAELREIFGRHGAVQSVNVVTDRETGRPRGFAFVQFEDASGAEAAQRALDGSDLGGRTIRVNEAVDRGRGGPGGGGRGGPPGGGGGAGRGGFRDRDRDRGRDRDRDRY
jgi:RNA recognition motif-containing protein